MKISKILLVTFLTSSMASCSTTLRCGSDGESSYVEIINVPSYYETKNYSAVCNFKELKNAT